MTQSVKERLLLAVEACDHAELRKIFKEHPQAARDVTAGRKTPVPILFKAIGANDPVMTRLLLEGGADVNGRCREQDFSDITPLLDAVRGNRDIGVINALLEFRADTRQGDRNGSTPLHHAIAHKRQDAAKALIAAGCDINAADIWMETPLHAAVKHKSPELIELLLENGARRDIENRWRETPRAAAAWDARNGDPDALAVFIRVAAKIQSAAVSGTAKPLRHAPKIALPKKGSAR